MPDTDPLFITIAERFSEYLIETLQNKLVSNLGVPDETTIDEIIDCPICLESTNKVSSLPCNHKFHYTCLKEWFKVNRNCPICRKN
jgi:hypothetical protein